MTLADVRVKEPGSPHPAAGERVLLRCRAAAELIRTGQYEEAREALGDLWRGVGARPDVEGLDGRAAAEVLLQAGALSNAGQALLALIEEHGAAGRLRPEEVYEAYLRADGLLRETQDAEDVSRLRACARVVMERLTTVELGGESFTLADAVHEFEAKLVERALEESGGSVVAAARLLGLTHQTFGSMLNTRHSRLAGRRKQPQTRRKSIIKAAKDGG